MSSSDLEALRSETTVDAVMRGQLQLHQPRRGYRFNLDALLLADFAARQIEHPPDLVIDLGCGCGVIGLLLARRWPAARVTLVEIQSELAQLASINADRNGLSQRTRVVCGDLREVAGWRPRGEERVLAVSNPPYFKPATGRLSPVGARALARHETTCSLGDLLAATGEGLRDADLLALIHTAERHEELLAQLRRSALQAQRMRFVRPFATRPPRRVLLAARKNPSLSRQDAPAVAADSAIEEAALVVHQRPGLYSDEARRIIGE